MEATTDAQLDEIEQLALASIALDERAEDALMARDAAITAAIVRWFEVPEPDRRTSSVPGPSEIGRRARVHRTQAYRIATEFPGREREYLARKARRTTSATD